MSEAPVIQAVTPSTHDLGDFRVLRSLPAKERTMVGPFIFFDQAGPAKLAPGQGIDVRPHPHINLATVTYMFEGSFLHRDSLGSCQLIEPGAVNLMTAGSGIVHSERSPDEDRTKASKLSAIQTWLALPDGREEMDPAFERSEEHTSELQSLLRISYAVFCLKKKTTNKTRRTTTQSPMT